MFLETKQLVTLFFRLRPTLIKITVDESTRRTVKSWVPTQQSIQKTVVCNDLFLILFKVNIL